MTQPNLVFLDTETTGLDRRRHDVWDIGLIVRAAGQPDQEHQWYVQPNLRRADPNGLRIGRYYDRMPDAPLGATYHYADGVSVVEDVTPSVAAAMLAMLLDGVIAVGIVPDFDAAMLRRFLRKHNQAWTAHYQVVDVEALAAGRLQLPPPWSTDEVLQRFGLRFNEAHRHTAIGDARIARDLYDQVMKAETVFDYDHYGDGSTGELLPGPIPGVVSHLRNFESGIDGSWAGSALSTLTSEIAPITQQPHAWSTCSHGADYPGEAEHDRDCPAMPIGGVSR